MFNEINKINPTAESDPVLANLKAKLRATWMDGDYAAFSAYMKPGATKILADWRIERGVRLLDVACGAGQTAIPAAKTGARVTGVDIASNLIEAARKQAALEGLHVQFDDGDAENLPYPEGAFDVVISLIGAMFAPRPEKVASELARVCRSGGRLYMANWTPDGMVVRCSRSSRSMYHRHRAWNPPSCGAMKPRYVTGLVMVSPTSSLSASIIRPGHIPSTWEEWSNTSEQCTGR